MTHVHVVHARLRPQEKILLLSFLKPQQNHVIIEFCTLGIASHGCHDEYKNGNRHSGVYTIQPSYMSWPFQVYCDMDTDGGGWTVNI